MPDFSFSGFLFTDKSGIVDSHQTATFWKAIWFLDSALSSDSLTDYEHSLDPSLLEAHVSTDEYYTSHDTPTPDAVDVYLLTPFQVFMDIGKDIENTFKPYKSSSEIWDDLLQPLLAVKHFQIGLFSLICCSFMFLTGTLPYLALSILAYPLMWIIEWIAKEVFDFHIGYCQFAEKALFPFLLAATGINLSWIASSITSMIQAIIHIIAIPLTWFVKIPIRGIITAITGMPKIENNPDMKRLGSKGHAALDELDALEKAELLDLNKEKEIFGTVKIIIKVMNAETIRATYKRQDPLIEPIYKSNLYSNLKFNDIVNNNGHDYKNNFISHAREYFKLSSVTSGLKNFLLFSYGQKLQYPKTSLENPVLNQDILNTLGQEHFASELSNYVLTGHKYRQ